MSAEFEELIQFRDKIQQLSEGGMSKFCDDVTKELAGRLLAKVIERTQPGKPPKEFDDKKKRKETETVTGVDGGKRKFLTKDATRYQQYWAGYVGGTLRRGWTGGEHVYNVSDYAKSLPINVISNEHRIDIINSVEYSIYVEYGHRQTPGRYVPALGKRLKKSWVSGKLIATKAVKELSRQADGIVERKLNQYMKEVFEDT